MCAQVLIEHDNHTESALNSLLKLHGLNSTLPIKCDFCPVKFNDWSLFDQHMTSHVECRQFFCQLCDNTYKTWSNLVAHRKACHQGRMLSCKVCTGVSMFPNISNVNFPIGGLEHGCELCKKGFNNIQLLFQHYASGHASETPLTLTAPETRKGKTSKRPSKHSKGKVKKISTKTTNTGPRKFICQYCARVYDKNSLLQLHLLRHTDTRQFSCLYCDKSFFTSTELRYHVHQHTGERPFKCPDCDKTYMSPAAASIHRQRKHPVVKTEYVCATCSKTFSWRHSYKRHMRGHVQAPFPCHKCNKKFFIKSNLDEHLNFHQQNKERRTCSDCNKEFITEKELKSHRKEQCCITLVLDTGGGEHNGNDKIIYASLLNDPS